MVNHLYIWYINENMNKKLSVRTRKGRVRTDQKSCGTLAGGGDLSQKEREKNFKWKLM